MEFFSSFGHTALFGGLIAAVVAGWQQVKHFLAWLRRLVICDVYVQHGLIEKGLRYWLRENGFLLPVRGKYYESFFLWERDGHCTNKIAENYRYQPLMFYFIGCRPLWLYSTEKEKSDKPVATKQISAESFIATDRWAALSFIRGTFSADELLRIAALTGETFRSRTSYETNGGCKYLQEQAAYIRPLDCSHNDLLMPQRSMEEVRRKTIAPEQVYDLFHEVTTWLESRDWYADRGIPWRRGWLIYGPPGSGKTSLIRAISHFAGLEVSVVRLAELNNASLQAHWRGCGNKAPVIIVIEDIDAVFAGRQNLLARESEQASFSMMMRQYADKAKSTTNADKPENTGAEEGDRLVGPRYVTFDCLLNTIDGADTPQGIFLVITTNKPETLDPALAGQLVEESGDTNKTVLAGIGTRPGRLDRVIRLGYMALEEKLRMVDVFLQDMPDKRDELRTFIVANSHLQETPAQMRERCVNAALEEFWRQKKNAGNAIAARAKEECSGG